jgi:Ala-tRNA(Pro) deacylase
VTAPQETYDRLIHLLDESRAQYRIIDHPAEGRTEIVSAMRGHGLSEAAKCLVLMIKLGKKTTKYVLTVVPGDRRVDLGAIKTLFAASYVSFAAPEMAEQLSGSVPGTILPFSFTPELALVADPSLLANATLYFNAARLDRSFALNTEDYERIARPRVECIASAQRE